MSDSESSTHSSEIEESADEIELPADEPIEVEKKQFVKSSERELPSKIQVLPYAEYKTSNKLSTFELTEVLSIRMSQIERTGKCFADDISDLKSVREMAERELNQRKNPLTLRRVVGERDGVLMVEEWKVNDMIW